MSVPDAGNSRASRGIGTEAAVRDPWPPQSSAVTDNEVRAIVTRRQAATVCGSLATYQNSFATPSHSYAAHSWTAWAILRLKTYLRSTMTQQRLNNVAVLHVHQRRLMSVSLDDILTDFISLNSQRMQTFGTMQ